MQAQEELRQIVQARSQALLQGNAERMNEILADGFSYTNARGQTLSKHAYIENYVSSREMKWLAQDVSDLHIELYGDVGVVTLRVHDRAKYQGNSFEGDYRSLFVYVKRNGAWRCVVGQTTAMTEG